jgi:hypothetical protein
MFKITKDLINKGQYENKFFLTGEDTKEQIKNSINNCKYEFRLLDGDGELYFEGLSQHNDCFEPLDTLTDDYGCTEIQYKDVTGNFKSA